jgi:hypothetical protein
VRRLGLILVLAALVAVVPRAGRAETPTLVATVGPGFSIAIKDATGQVVRNLDAGAYTVQVHDETEAHNLHLSGPGVDQATEVEGEGDFTWPVTLSVGTYRYLCDVHPSLNGSFAVSAPPPALPPPPPPPPTALPPAPPPKLVATVGPGASISLRTAAGARVTKLAAAVYSIRLRDRSKRDNFHLTGPGVNRKSGRVQTGALTWKVAVRPGAYRYRSDFHKALKGSFTAKASD